MGALWLSPRHSFTPAGGGVEYVNIKDRGAALFMRDPGYSAEVDAAAQFASYAKRHAKRWFAFATAHGLDLKTASDDGTLVLVRGFVKTTGWRIGTFHAHLHRYTVALHAAASPLPAEAHAKVIKVRGTVGEPEWRSGPASMPKRALVGMKKYDQCVFIVGVKCGKASMFGSVSVSAVP